MQRAADIVGPTVAKDLAGLQDKLPPFDQSLIPQILDEALGEQAKTLLDISDPIAAASIAQVHSATIKSKDGERQKVAVKFLRPDVEVRFKKDLASLRAAAQFVEFVAPKIAPYAP